MQPLSPLTALSPLDGRYADQVSALAELFSEAGLMRHRVAVEVEYLLALLGWREHPAALDPAVGAALRRCYLDFDLEDARAVKVLERETRHDMKAIEYWVKGQVALVPALAAEVELVHLGLTSEDINNLAYALMHQGALLGPLFAELGAILVELSRRTTLYRAEAMLARTHGQPASPTTMGKELGVFASRLSREAFALLGFRFTGKLSGATGTLAAHAFAYPGEPWLERSRQFVEELGLGLDSSPVTTQVEPGDSYAAFYDQLRRINQILVDASQDMWRYVSDDYFKQRVVMGEVGSSAMPHKVNPIDFENAEGNLGLANALLLHLGQKLPVSRLQRDLSGSTVLRNAGVALGHTLVGWRSFLKGLDRVELDAGRLARELEQHPEVLAEAIQTLLRARGREVPYEKLKALTRGTQPTLAGLKAAATELAPELAATWAQLSPAAYIGLAPELADAAASYAADVAGRIEAFRAASGTDLLKFLAAER